MKGAKRPIYDNGRDRRLEGDEQERLFRSARREDLIRARGLAIEALLIEPRERAKNARNKSGHQRFLKRARHQALKQLRRGYPVVPLYESLIAFALTRALCSPVPSRAQVDSQQSRRTLDAGLCRATVGVQCDGCGSQQAGEHVIAIA
jgi:hypothetical protein